LGRIDRGVKQARFVVIREQKIPAVLVELMFINDDTEEGLLQQDATRESAAGAIAEGLRQYVEGSGTASAERLASR
jgi:N-acetylmuramoyl-L-alanine amidase